MTASRKAPEFLANIGEAFDKVGRFEQGHPFWGAFTRVQRAVAEDPVLSLETVFPPKRQTTVLFLVAKLNWMRLNISLRRRDLEEDFMTVIRALEGMVR